MGLSRTNFKIMAGQGLKYNVDIVMCIDCTGSMGDLLDTVKTRALTRIAVV